MRVIAKPKISAKTASASIASPAAAAITFGATNARMNSNGPAAAAGTVPGAGAAAMSAAAACSGIGHSASNGGVTSALTAAPAVSRIAKSRIERPVILPAAAALVVEMMPVTISANTRGTIVILSASSHNPPIASAPAMMDAIAGQAAQSQTAPSTRPAASPVRICHALVMRPPCQASMLLESRCDSRRAPAQGEFPSARKFFATASSSRNPAAAIRNWRRRSRQGNWGVRERLAKFAHKRTSCSRVSWTNPGSWKACAVCAAANWSASRGAI